MVSKLPLPNGAGARGSYRSLLWISRLATLAALGFGAWWGLERFAPALPCRLGAADSCVNASLRALEQETEDPAAFELSQRGCELGAPMACNNLGVCLQRGVGTRQDYVAARKAYEQACAAGQGLGCLNLGRLRQQGLGGTADPERARRSFEKGCELGEARACGAVFELAKTPAEKLAWAKKACGHGSPEGCALTAVTIAVIEPQSPELGRRAAELNSACANEHAPSCAALGVLHFLGAGTRQDPERAKQLFAEACRLGNGWACNRRDVSSLESLLGKTK